jgi:uncharacterized membrane protein YraQ (UPF0718 family)
VGTAVWHTLPFFLISIALSVLIRALNLDGFIRRAFNARVGKAILLATVVGAFSPFCSCTVIPIIAGLVMSGVPLAPIMAFWIASPTMDPEIFVLSVGILGWPLALARLGATLALSVGAGYATLALGQFVMARQKVVAAESCCTTSSLIIPLPVMQPALAVVGTPTAVSTCTSSSCSRPITTGPDWRDQLVRSFQQITWTQFGRDVSKQSWELGRWLLLAFLLEALITLFIPQAAIANLLGESNRFAVPLAALIGIPLYLNNLGALPIVAGLLAQGMQPGAAIAFLIAGPVTTIPAMTAVWGIVERRVFVLYLSLSLLGAILLGFVTNWLLG